MPDKFPPIEPVKTRAAFASGGRREKNTRAILASDPGATFALVMRGLTTSAGRSAIERVTDLALRIFKERTSSMLDDLAEVWWRAEHGADEGARVRPFSSLPIADRADLRARVKKLLAERVPDALGDQAVLEAETKRLLDLPASSLRRSANELDRLAERDKSWVGTGAVVEAAIFAAGHVSIAHIGDGAVLRLRRGDFRALTRQHTLSNMYDDASSDAPAPHLPGDAVFRALGMPGEASRIEAKSFPLERRDIYLLVTRGLLDAFNEPELRAALQKDGVEAARRLVEAASARSETELGAVAVEIL